MHLFGSELIYEYQAKTKALKPRKPASEDKKLLKETFFWGGVGRFRANTIAMAAKILSM